MSNWNKEDREQFISGGEHNPRKRAKRRHDHARQGPHPLFWHSLEGKRTQAAIDEAMASLREELDDLIGVAPQFTKDGDPTWNQFSRFTPKDHWRPINYTIAQHGDGSPCYVELRFQERHDDRVGPPPHKPKKTFRIVFRDDYTGQSEAGVKPLAEHDLLIPIGAPALVQALRAEEGGSGERVIVWWAEGEKTRKALEELSRHPHAIERAKQLGARVVACAWLSGAYGAANMNFRLKPRLGSDPYFTIEGVNDVELDLDHVLLHMFFCDNDSPGRKETSILVNRFANEYGVPREKLVVVYPPGGVIEGWDDADPLPSKMTKEDRIDRIFDAQSASVMSLQTEHGKPHPNIYNACVLLEGDDAMRETFQFNEMTLEVDVMKPTPGSTPRGDYPRSLDDGDITDTIHWMQEQRLFMITEATTRKAILRHAHRYPYHPIRDYYESLTWDGTPRIDNSFVVYWGAQPCGYTTPDGCEACSLDRAYVMLVGKYWWMQLVARIYDPGCQADYMLVLIDTQGELKSTSFKKIVIDRDHFTDSIKDIVDHRKAGGLMRGKQIIEFAEMVALKKAGEAIAKAFITQTIDEYQPPYGHTNVKQLRQNVLVATTNHPQCLHDPTGNRRDWTIVCGVAHSIDLAALERDRDQLLAEAVHRYKSGERYWPTRTEEKLYFKPEQDEHVAEEMWQVLVAEALEELQNVDGVCVNMGQIIQFLRDRGGKVPKPSDIGSYLRKLKWTNETVRVNGMVKRFWWREDQRDKWLRPMDGRPKAPMNLAERAARAAGQPEWEQVKTRYLAWHGGSNGVWSLGKPGCDEPTVLTPAPEGEEDYDAPEPRPNFAGPKPEGPKATSPTKP